MTFTEFKDHLITFLWKAGDQVLIANLDNLIKMADSELNRKLLIPEREVSTVMQVTSQDFPLPTDYYSFRDIMSAAYNRNLGEWKYLTPAELLTQRAGVNYGDPSNWASVYSLRGTDTIMLAGNFSETSPVELQLTYQTKVPDFATTDTSWLAEFYLDLYTYAVLKHATTFLREDERLQVWGQLYNDALISAIETAEYERVRGKSAQMQLPRAASTGGTGGYYSNRFGG